jgi:hypothetical protein
MKFAAYSSWGKDLLLQRNVLAAVGVLFKALRSIAREPIGRGFLASFGRNDFDRELIGRPGAPYQWERLGTCKARVFAVMTKELCTARIYEL